MDATTIMKSRPCFPDEDQFLAINLTLHPAKMLRRFLILETNIVDRSNISHVYLEGVIANLFILVRS